MSAALITACVPPNSSETQNSSTESATSAPAPARVAEPSSNGQSPKQPIVEKPQETIDKADKASTNQGSSTENIDTSAPVTVECVPWQTYKSDLPDPRGLPNMPAGFENGCTFGTNLAGEASDDPISLYILRDGVALDRVFDPSVLIPASMDVGIPNVNRRAIDDTSGFAHELIASGNAMLLHYGDPRSCEVSGGLYPDGYYQTDFDDPNNCGFASPHRVHTVSADPPVVCFRTNCLETYADNISEEDLLALWEPWQTPVPNTAINSVRFQYNTIDLNTLSPELRRASYRPDVERLLMQEFGRTTLEEGEQPTVITQDDTKGKDYWYLHIVTLTNKGLADDSVGGFRYRFEFEPYDGDTLLLVWAGSQQFCWRSEEWTKQLCP
ncbi:MAG: hypothetical protein AAGD25_16625 [Cyanobacteria bacterium P01_F01_bin.150]